MTNLPKALREKLAGTFSLHTLELVRKQGAHDTTQKFLWRLRDHSLIESVLIPANPALYGEASDRHTLCISTQVGCAYGCKFCASGLDGWKRNLTPDEIVEQVLAVERLVPVSSPQFESQKSCEFDTRSPRHSSRDWLTIWSSWAWANRWRITNICSRRSNPERALGRRHRRAQNHDFHQRPGAADPPAGRRAAAIPPGHFPARRDGRSAQQNHARQPQVSAQGTRSPPARITRGKRAGCSRLSIS